MDPRSQAGAGRADSRRLHRLTPNEARHTYASLMIAAGVNAKALSEFMSFMGHSSIQVTLALHGHLMPGAEDEAASLLDTLLAGAEEQARSSDGSEERSAHRGCALHAASLLHRESPANGNPEGCRSG